MNRLAMFAVVAIALTACDQRAADEEERYRIVSRNGSDAEKCTQARAVAEAYLQSKNEAKYKEWKLTADIYCMSATLPRY